MQLWQWWLKGNSPSHETTSYAFCQCRAVCTHYCIAPLLTHIQLLVVQTPPFLSQGAAWPVSPQPELLHGALCSYMCDFGFASMKFMSVLLTHTFGLVKAPVKGSTVLLCTDIRIWLGWAQINESWAKDFSLLFQQLPWRRKLCPLGIWEREILASVLFHLAPQFVGLPWCSLELIQLLQFCTLREVPESLM